MLHLEGFNDTERRILTAALDCFVEQGYFATTIPQIVKRAQVSTGSIYHHFKDKQTLAEAVVNQLLRSIEQALDQLATHPQDPMSDIRAIIHWMLEQATGHPKIIRFILYAQHQEFLPHLPPLCTQAPFEKMRQLVLRAQQTGQLPTMDPIALSALVFGPTLRMVQAHVDGALPNPLPTYAPALMEGLSLLTRKHLQDLEVS